MPVPSLDARPRRAARIVLAVCASALLVTTIGGPAAPAVAVGLTDQISSSRRSQNYSESQMLAQDRELARIKLQAKLSRKQFKQANRAIKRARRALSLARKVVHERRARLARVEALFDDPSEAAQPGKYKQRLRTVRRDLRIAQKRKSAIGKRVRIMTRTRKYRRYRLRALKRQRRIAIARRETAEDALAYRIVRITDLARERAENQTAVSLGAGGGSFSWPTTGRISQTYGCTGFRLNPRRGSCRHFHDGLDIVDAYGTPVRAAAVGVVAYEGWNPWDEHGRAWIVVVVHADGFVSRYGHMTPTDRVRVGQVVHTGQIIGKMGNTGRSTGTHLHFELLQGRSSVNPLAYLPAGVIRIKVDKTSTKQGQRAAARKARARVKAKARARAAARKRKAAKANDVTLPEPGLSGSEVLGPVLQVCEQAAERPDTAASGAGLLAQVTDPTDDSSADGDGCVVDDTSPHLVDGSPYPADRRRDVRSAPADAVAPGVRLPFRGTSPVPA